MFVCIRSQADVYVYVDQVLEQWCPLVEESSNKGIVVLVTSQKEWDITGGLALVQLTKVQLQEKGGYGGEARAVHARCRRPARHCLRRAHGAVLRLHLQEVFERRVVYSSM